MHGVASTGGSSAPRAESVCLCSTIWVTSARVPIGTSFAMAKDVPIGTRAEVTQIVEHKHTLSALGAELPPVLATPCMIGWMEYACYQAQQPFCDDGETTVGTAVHVDHRA